MLLLPLLFLSSLAMAYEADDFSQRLVVPEIGNFLDEEMNRELKAAAQKVSAKNCHPQPLHQEIMSKLGGFLFSEIEDMDMKAKIDESTGKEIVSKNRGGRIKSSVYRELADPLSRFGKLNKGACCASAFRYRGMYLSSDKLGHFLHSGYEAFFYAELQNQKGYLDVSKENSVWNQFIRELTEVNKFAGKKGGSQAVLELSADQENGLWGLTGSGIYSYADIVANVEGYKFWKQLTEGENPYFTCDQGKWTMARAFSWSEYINAGWDEAINCNSYKNETIQTAVRQGIEKALKQQGFKHQQCPVDPVLCQKLGKMYSGEFSEAVHPIYRETKAVQSRNAPEEGRSGL